MTTSLPLSKAFTLFAIFQTLAAVILVAAFYIRLWPLELYVSFTNIALILLMASLIFSTLFLAENRELRRGHFPIIYLGFGWIFALFALIFSLNVVEPIDVNKAEGPVITFATFNKYYGNKSADGVTYFKDQNVDVLALQEAQPNEVKQIAEQLGFKYSISSRKLKTAVGTVTAIISRYPIESAKTVNLDTDHPVVRAVITTPENGKVVFYAVHIPVPLTQKLYEKRDRVTESFASKLKEEALPVIVGGDFNTTNYSPSLRLFNEEVEAKIRPIAVKYWPSCSWYGLGSSMCVRIDHIYIPNNAKLTNFSISDYLGSDHRALIATIELQAERSKR